jgi:hypothetical protein
MNQYYLRRIALDERKVADAGAMISSLKYFATRIEETFEEVVLFKDEIGASKEERQ